LNDCGDQSIGIELYFIKYTHKQLRHCAPLNVTKKSQEERGNSTLERICPAPLKLVRCGQMPEPESVRMDKWLWAARVFKTRSLAAAACHHGHVTVAALPVKASRDVRVNDVIVIKQEEITRTFKVLQLLRQRVGAALVKNYAQDLTPESEYQKKREPRLQPLFFRPKGSGRPTKKERRAINGILESS
jgi:ribosome-associated heat shock protein Hsp15